LIHSYNILCKVAIYHHYYGIDPLGSIAWLPSSSTVQMARNRGVIFKSTHAGVDLYASCRYENNAYFLDYPLQEAFSLIFYISFNDSYWSNITALHLKEKNKKWYFSNVDAVDREGELHTLHKEKYVSLTNQIVTVEKGVRYSLGTSLQEEVAVYKKGNSIENLSFLIETINGETFLNTRIMDEGSYLIKEGEKWREEVFVTDAGVSYDAICQLFFDPSLANNILHQNWSWKSTSFQIRYDSLKTYWQYVFPKEKLEDIEGLQLVDAKHQEVFSEPSEGVIDGKAIFSFTSTEPIALERETTHAFQLKKNVNIPTKTEGVVINRLPTPSKEVLYRLDNEGNKYSIIYINF